MKIENMPTNKKFKGNFGTLNLSIEKDGSTSGNYQNNKGQLKGTISNNIFKGTYTNAGTQGLIEFVITDGELTGKWKKGLNKGAMRGKWKGIEIIDEQNTSKTIEQTIKVKASFNEGPFASEANEIFLEEYLYPDIKEIIVSDLGMRPNLFDNVYNHFSTIFNQGNVIKDFDPSMPINKLKNFKHSIISQKSSYGIDLPVWFTIKNKNRQKIMLIGMDPLRQKSTEGEIGKVASLNTPYSIHHRVRNNYYPSISLLASQYDIYITDVFKLFFREPEDPDFVSNQNTSFTELAIHTKLLQKEITAFSPDLILCLGKQPVNDGLAKIGLTRFIPSIVTKIDNISLTSIPIYAIPHATGLASKHAKRFMEEKNRVKHNSKTYIVDAVKLILDK
ncbi:uracil-DNA glycosylase family protein [Flavobacteriales bacterium]|nr:uracil-DNA glycosylase family protein [Flavobacteriales bacterium]